MPGAQVCLFEQQIRNGMRGVWLRTVANSNNDGSYRLGGLRRGSYFIAVSARPWYARFTQHPSGQTVEADEQKFDVAYPVTFYPATASAQEAAPLRIEPGSKVQANMTLNAVPAAHLQVQSAPGSRMLSVRMEPLIPWTGNGNIGLGWLDGDSSQTNSIAPGSYRFATTWSDAKGEHTSRRVIEVAGDSTLDVSAADDFAVTASVVDSNYSAARLPGLALRNVSNGFVVRGRRQGKRLNGMTCGCRRGVTKWMSPRSRNITSKASPPPVPKSSAEPSICRASDGPI